jgi:hypothetical protein
MSQPKQKKARGGAKSPKSAPENKGLKDLPAKASVDVRGGTITNSLPIEVALTTIYSQIEDDATKDLKRVTTPKPR